MKGDGLGDEPSSFRVLTLSFHHEMGIKIIIQKTMLIKRLPPKSLSPKLLYLCHCMLTCYFIFILNKPHVCLFPSSFCRPTHNPLSCLSYLITEGDILDSMAKAVQGASVVLVLHES